MEYSGKKYPRFVVVSEGQRGGVIPAYWNFDK